MTLILLTSSAMYKPGDKYPLDATLLHSSDIDAFRQAYHTLPVSSHRHQHNFSDIPADYAITCRVTEHNVKHILCVSAVSVAYTLFLPYNHHWFKKRSILATLNQCWQPNVSLVRKFSGIVNLHNFNRNFWASKPANTHITKNIHIWWSLHESR